MDEEKNNVDNNNVDNNITTVNNKNDRGHRFLKGFLTGILCALVVVVLAFAGLYMFSSGRIGSSESDSLDLSAVRTKLGTLESMVDRYYLYPEDIDAEVMTDAVYKGYIDSLGDPYTVYYNAEEYSEMLESSSGEYLGIGVYLMQDADNVISVIEVFKDSGAEEAGLMADDIICKVDGVDITGEGLDYVVSLIKGDEGTFVTIEVYRPIEDSYISFEIERRVVQVSTVIWEMKDDGIGYIDIVEFDSVTDGQFTEALEDLKEQGMEGLIIDLRSNPGGLLDVCVNIADSLMCEGTIVYTTSSIGKDTTYEADEDISFDGPIVVLVNENSASASEILTGALKDNERAVIVGTTTYGKGIVQSIFSLGDGTALKITTADYYTPNGVSIHGTGIEPDVEVEVDVTVEDNQLDTAVEILEGLMN